MAPRFKIALVALLALVLCFAFVVAGMADNAKREKITRFIIATLRNIDEVVCFKIGGEAIGIAALVSRFVQHPSANIRLYIPCFRPDLAGFLRHSLDSREKECGYQVAPILPEEPPP